MSGDSMLGRFSMPFGWQPDDFLSLMPPVGDDVLHLPRDASGGSLVLC